MEINLQYVLKKLPLTQIKVISTINKEMNMLCRPILFRKVTRLPSSQILLKYGHYIREVVDLDNFVNNGIVIEKFIYYCPNIQYLKLIPYNPKLILSYIEGFKNLELLDYGFVSINFYRSFCLNT